MEMVAYFDESEQENTSFCMAGWFAPIDQWKPLEDQWLAILQKEGITPEFKMADCFNAKGAFESVKVRADRQRVADELLGVTLDHHKLMPTGLVIGFDLAAFDRIVAPRIRRDLPRYDNAWLWAFRFAVEQLVGAQRFATTMVGVNERIGIVFDTQNEYSRRALSLIEQAKRDDPTLRDVLGPVSFADSQQEPGLQMADQLAWEARRAISEFLKTGKPSTRREQWVRIYRSKRPDGGPRVIPFVWDEKMLTAMPVEQLLPW